MPRTRVLVGLLAALAAGCTHDFDAFDVGSGQSKVDAGTGGNPGTLDASSGAESGSGGAGPMGAGGGGGFIGVGGSSRDGGANTGGALGTGGALADDSGTCGSTQKLCGGTCVPNDAPATGCGAASCAACALSNTASSRCTSGACAPRTCANGFDDCNGLPGDGCEVSLVSDALACGSCTRGCSADHVESRTCTGGQCNSSCDLGRANCVHPASGNDDGCETDATTDTTNCGGCGNDCNRQNGKTCKASLCGCSSDGACQSGGAVGTITCDTGSGLCHCDAATCQHGESCRNGACACNGQASCTAGQTCCRSPAGCKTLATDSANCGACGRACASGFVCVAGACQCDGDTDCSAGTSGVCSAGVCHCGVATCGSGERCLPDGSCG